MPLGELEESAALVVRVVVDVQVRVLTKAIHHEVHEVNECLPFSRSIHGLEGLEVEGLPVEKPNAKHVFEADPVIPPWEALHVEPDVSGRPRRKAAEPSGVDDLPYDGVVPLASDLKRGLIP